MYVDLKTICNFCKMEGHIEKICKSKLKDESLNKEFSGNNHQANSSKPKKNFPEATHFKNKHNFVEESYANCSDMYDIPKMFCIQKRKN